MIIAFNSKMKTSLLSHYLIETHKDISKRSDRRSSYDEKGKHKWNSTEEQIIYAFCSFNKMNKKLELKLKD